MFLFQAGTSLEGRVTQILIELNSLENWHKVPFKPDRNGNPTDGTGWGIKNPPNNTNSWKGWELHHIKPLSWGGDHDFSNLVPCVEGIINRLQIGGIPMRPTSRTKTWQTE